jgi:hypothetical protein
MLKILELVLLEYNEVFLAVKERELQYASFE